MGKGREVSPVEAYRKQQRKKEAERNKRQREAFKELKDLNRADVKTVRTELVRLQELDKQGRLDNAHRSAMHRVAEIYQKKLMEISANGKQPQQTVNKRPMVPQHQPGGPVPPSLKKMKLTPPPPPQKAVPVFTRPVQDQQPAETEIFIGTGGLMPTALRVRRTCAPAPKKKPEDIEMSKEQQSTDSPSVGVVEKHDDCVADCDKTDCKEETVPATVCGDTSSGEQKKDGDTNNNGKDGDDDDDVLAQFEEEMKQLGAI